MASDDLAAHARALLDANGFLTLGTVDPDGRPWTSPRSISTRASGPTMAVPFTRSRRRTS
ncbi:MAG TPA: pyridoxamine 5'-phosphate oxidase family protein [Asanoa sp.]|nr:pyridoxamine 5'-phosphate oxidase family protein [Asanoa sp.]